MTVHILTAVAAFGPPMLLVLVGYWLRTDRNVASGNVKRKGDYHAPKSTI